MSRVKFKKSEQRKFFLRVLEKTNCPSLRALNQFGFDIPYSTLKNYFTEKRLISKEFFLQLCELSDFDSTLEEVSFLDENWGKAKGGSLSKR